MTDPRRALPSVDKLLKLPGVAKLLEDAPRNVVVAAVRERLERSRGEGAVPENWETEIAEAVQERVAPSLFPVLNATGVVLHTNLGRAPLPAVAIQAMVAVAAGYSNLELDVATGSRGSRLDHCASLLAEVAAAEAGFVVNNAAGALVVALNALAAGREVIISRGELIEIGGSFRIPDILGKSGAILREVGTTNRTHLDDYQQALGDTTGAILVVHRSNFAMEGFVASPDLPDLAGLARAHSIPLIHDVGSGLLVDLSDVGLVGEPLVQEATHHADAVVMSGDKLLGGPQAGCIVGRRAIIARLTKNPFARAMRSDKFTLAALEATLRLYRDPARARAEIPVLRMLTTPAGELAKRARAVADAIPASYRATLLPGQSAVGGGSFPGAALPTTVVSLDPGGKGPNALALALRLGSPSLMCRVEADRVVLDPRTLTDSDIAGVAQALARAAR